MVVDTEAEFRLQDGTKLYTRTWTPDAGTTSSAHLIFLHGFSDHCSAYHNTFPTLASPPYSISVYSFDQRGWGKSVAKNSDKGNLGGTHQVLSDFHEFFQHIASLPEVQNKPLFLMGHSMGGCNALYYLLLESLRTPFTESQPRVKFAGLLLEAPYFELHPRSQPGSFTVMVGKLAAKLLPSRQLIQPIDPKFMSRDPKVCQEWADDALCHDTGTLEGLAGLLQRAGDLESIGKGKSVPHLTTSVPCPVWSGHGDADLVISFDASKRVFEKLEVPDGDKQFKVYEGGYHKLYAEPDGVGQQFVKDVGDWILAHVNKPKVGQ